MPRVEREVLTAQAPVASDSSAQIRGRVSRARDAQLKRAGKPNAQLTPQEIQRDCVVDEPGKKLLDAALSRLGLSARAYHRVLKVARSIADLAASAAILPAHLAEAIGYRELNRD